MEIRLSQVTSLSVAFWLFVPFNALHSFSGLLWSNQKSSNCIQAVFSCKMPVDYVKISKMRGHIICHFVPIFATLIKVIAKMMVGTLKSKGDGEF